MRSSGKLSRYTAVGLSVAGFLLMFLAWDGAAEKDFIQGQFPYLLSGTIPGLALVAAGLALAAITAHREDAVAIQDKLDELLAALDRAQPASPALAAVPDSDDVVVAGRSTYHRADCRLVSGRPGLDLLAAADAADRGLTPCRVCRPAA